MINFGENRLNTYKPDRKIIVANWKYLHGIFIVLQQLNLIILKDLVPLA